MKRIAFACALSCATMWGGAGAEEISGQRSSHVFGALAIDYDPADWTVEDETTIAIRREQSWHSVVVTLHALDADDAPCSIEAMEERARSYIGWAAPHGSTTLRRDGFDVHVGVIDLGCRNWAGAPVAACAIADGRLHLMTSIGGCELHHSNAERVLELLEGARLR